MRRRQTTAILLSMILTVSAFLPFNGIQAMAAEESAGQDTAVIQSEAPEYSEGDSSEKAEEASEETVTEEAEERGESSVAVEPEEEAVSDADETSEQDSASDEAKAQEENAGALEEEGSSDDVTSNTDSSEDAGQPEDNMDDHPPITAAPSEAETVRTDAVDGYNESYLHAWVEGYEEYKDDEYQNITIDSGHFVIGDTYPICISTESSESTNITFEWYKANYGDSPDTLIEGENDPTFMAYLEDYGWNGYVCKISDDQGNNVEILIQISVNEPDEFDLAREIAPGEIVDIEGTDENPEPLVRFTVPETGSYRFDINCSLDGEVRLYDSVRSELSYHNFGSDPDSSYFSERLVSGETYYLRIAEWNHGQFSATLTFDRAGFAVYGEEHTTVRALQGQQAELSVDADGRDPISYQWYKGCRDCGQELEILSGETGNTFLADPEVSQFYSCYITNGSEEAWRCFDISAYTLRAWIDGYDQNDTSGYQTIEIDTGTQSEIDLHVCTEYVGTGEIAYQWYYADLDADWSEEALEPIEGANTESFYHDLYQHEKNVSCLVTDGNESCRINIGFTFSGYLRAWAEGHEDQSENHDQYVDVRCMANNTLDLRVEAQTLDDEEPDFEWFDSESGETLGYGREYNFIAPDETGTRSITCKVTDKYNNRYDITFWIEIVGTEYNLKAWVEGMESWEDTAYLDVQRGESRLLQVHAETADGSEVTYEWHETGDGFDHILSDYTDSLFQTPELYSDNDYYCIVKDHYGNEHRVSFEIFMEQIDNQLYAYPEGNDIYQNSIDIDSIPPGGTVTLHTMVSAIDPDGITYQWRDGGEEEDIEGETSDTLVVSKVGFYICRVTDKYNNWSEAYFYVSMENHLKAWPQGADINYDGEHLTYLDISGEIGHSYNLITEIEADYRDNLDIQWYEVIEDGTGGYINEENVCSGSNTFNTGPLNKSVTYRCFVTDTFGNCVDVTYEISFNHLKAFVYGTAEEESASYLLAPGQTQELRVGVSADDLSGIEYHWTSYTYDPDQGMWDSKEYEGTDSDSLQASAQGEYECTVTDGYGNSFNVWFYIYVNHFEAHGNGVNRGGYYVVSTGVGVPAELQVIAEGDDLEKVSYEWTYTYWEEGIFGEPIPGAAGPVCALENPSNKGTYQCEINDGYGNVCNVEFKICTNHLEVTAEGAGDDPGNIEIQADENGDATLKVNVSADDMSGINIEWMYLSPWEVLQSGPEDSYQIHLPLDSYGEEDYVPVIRCTVRDQYGNEYYLDFTVRMPSAPFVEVYANLMDINGEDIPEDFAGIYGTWAGQEFGFVAPRVEGYNFKGWYVHSDEAPGYTGDVLCTSRNFKGIAEEQGNEYSAVYEPLGRAKIVINGGESFYVNGSEMSTEITSEYPLGSSITVEANSPVFAYWKNSAGAVLSRSASYTFTVTSSETISAVFNTVVPDKATIVFESAYSQVLARIQLASGGSSILPTLPTRTGYNTIGWDMDGDGEYNKTSDTLEAAIERGLAAEDKVVTIYAVYELKEIQYTITVNKGTGSGTYHQDDNVTAVANAPEEGMIFSHWKNADGSILSYNKSYSFLVGSDLEITAVYVNDTETVEALGTTGIIDMYQDTDNKKLSFVSMSTVPKGCSMDCAGVIATDNQDTALSGDGFNADTAKFVRGMSWTGTSCRFTWTKGKVEDGNTWYVRAYLVYTDAEGNVHTVYGDPVWQTFDSNAE